MNAPIHNLHNTGFHLNNYIDRSESMERREFLKLGLTGIGAAVIAEKSLALTYYPKSSDKKWAILYSTWCGSSRDAGIWISEGMGGIADVFDLRENPDLKGFDHMVIGSSIRGWKIAPEMAAYLEKNKDWIKDKIRGYYIICGNMRRPVEPAQKKAYIDDQLAKITGVNNVPGKVFLGRITRALLDPQSVQMFDRMNMPDYDVMNRADFLVYGKTILESITAS